MLHEHWHEKSRHAHPTWTSVDSWNEIFESRNQQIKESPNQKVTLPRQAECESKTIQKLSNHGRPFETDNVP